MPDQRLFTIRITSLFVLWMIAMVAGVFLALSEDDWAERLAEKLGGKDWRDGVAIRFAVLCIGVFVFPVVHIMVFEAIIRAI